MRFVTAHSMVFRPAQNVLASGFVLPFIFYGLGAKVKGDHRGENGQKFLPGNIPPQRQHAEHAAGRQSDEAFDAQKLVDPFFHLFLLVFCYM